MERNFLPSVTHETSASKCAGPGGLVVDRRILRLDAAPSHGATESRTTAENDLAFSCIQTVCSSRS